MDCSTIHRANLAQNRSLLEEITGKKVEMDDCDDVTAYLLCASMAFFFSIYSKY
jgi:hypothetical protein